MPLARNRLLENLEPLILVDVMNLVWRSHFAFHSLRHEESWTSVLYGFLKTVLRMRELVSPRMVFCWDTYGVPGDEYKPCWRVAKFADYKASRKGLDENPEIKRVVPQLGPLYQALGMLGYPSIGIPGLEADDIIGILATQVPGKILIYSNDKDMYQLLTPDKRVQVLWSNPKEPRKYHTIDAQEVETRHGVPVDRWVDYLAFGGDGSDNIKPVSGLGPETAKKFVALGGRADLPFGQNPDAFCDAYLKKATVNFWPRFQACRTVAAVMRRLPRLAVPENHTPGVLGGSPDGGGGAKYPPTPENPATDLKTPTAAVLRAEPYRLHPILSPGWKSEQEKRESQREFQGFCADYGLLEFLANYHKFFAEKAGDE
jgi:5'-3' exonuclease